MAESHVVSALANKRAEIAGMIARAQQQIGQFRADLAHMGLRPVKRDLLRHCDSFAGGSEARAHLRMRQR